MMHIKHLESRFSSLTDSICSELIDARLDIEKILSEILFVPRLLKRKVSHIASHHLVSCATRQRPDIRNLFAYLDATTWNFVDYALLEHLISIFASNKLKEEMAIYARDMFDFKHKTTVSQLNRFWLRQDIPQVYADVYSNITVKVKRDPDACTLEQICALRREMCERFLPPLAELAVLIHSFSAGSVIVTFYIALDLVKYLTNELIKYDSQEFFTEHAIESLYIKDILMYPPQVKGDTS